MRFLKRLIIAVLVYIAVYLPFVAILQAVCGGDYTAAYSVGGILRFYDEKRTAIMEKCCDTENDKYIPKPEMSETLEKEMRELLDLDIDMDEIKAVRIPAEEDMRLSYADLCALEGLIEVDFNEEKEN